MNNTVSTKKKLLIALASFVIVIAISVATAFTLHTELDPPISPTPQRPAVTSSDIEIPATTEAQNKKGDETIVDAATAIKNGNKDEAKKQSANALKLYTAANNQQGIDQAKMSAQVAEAIPTPAAPTPVTTAPAR